MKTGWIIALGFVAFLVFGGMGACSKIVGTNNNLVTMEEGVFKSLAGIDVAMQRRMDLIPSLVETVKGYAGHESATLTAVMEARAGATKVTIDPKNATPEQLAKYQAAQGQLSQALGRLMMVQEQYPNLKADKHFSDLMAQLEGTENRIKVARDDYNKSAAQFNAYARSFPNNIINGMFAQLKLKEPFKADEGAKVAPKVSFDKTPAKS